MLDRNEARFRILRLLDADPSMSQRQLSRALGISLGRVNYCLRALVEKGEIKMRNFREADRKLHYAYVLTPAGLEAKAHLTVRFLQRKIEEYELLTAEIEQLRREAQEQEQGGLPPVSEPQTSRQENSDGAGHVRTVRNMVQSRELREKT